MSEHDRRWTEFIEAAHRVDMLDVADRLGAKLKKSGKDHYGPCPRAACAERDGFVVTPSLGVFLCRKADVSGDAIAMVQHVKDLPFVEAVEFVTRATRPDRSRDETSEQREAREARWRQDKADAEKRNADAADAAARKASKTQESNAAIVARALPFWNSPAHAYLVEGRGLTITERLCRDLLFVSDLPYWGYADPGARSKTLLATVPAMVARLRDARGDDGPAIHITWLDPNEPRKFRPPDPDRNAVKKYRGSPTGCLIRMGRPSRVMAIGEGIETTFGWYGLGAGGDEVSIAVAAALGGLATAVLPDVVEEVILLGDRDTRHEAATNAKLIKAGKAHAATGRKVFISMAPPTRDPKGLDWADVKKRMGGRGC